MHLAKLLLGGLVATLVHWGAIAQPVYKVGSTSTGNPFTFLDVKTNKIDGLLVDVINELGKEGGFKVEVDAMPFTALVPSLSGGKINIISAAMTITPARAEVVDFSEPLFPYSEGAVVLKDDTKPYKSARDFAGQVVGVQGGTTYFEYLKRVGGFAEIKTYDSIADIMRDVALGRIKAGFVDDPIMRFRLNQDKSSPLRRVDTYEPGVVGQVALAVKKGDAALLNQLNAGIAKIKADGRMEKLQTKWGLR